MKTLIITYMLGLLLLEAWADSLQYRKLNSLYHWVDSLFILLALSSTFIITPARFVIFLIAFIALRYAIFNYLFNIMAGLKLDYLSKEVFPDRFLAHYPFLIVLFSQLLALILSLSLIINEM